MSTHFYCKLTIAGFHRFEWVSWDIIQRGIIEIAISPKLAFAAGAPIDAITYQKVQFLLKSFDEKSGFAEFVAE